MKVVLSFILTSLFAPIALSQNDVSQLLAAENRFLSAAQKEMRSAFLTYLTPDSILFRPEAVNGMDYWQSRSMVDSEVLVRRTMFADISANGLLGFTTGTWRLMSKGQGQGNDRYGEYVTIWVKRGNDEYRASLDIAITHDGLHSEDSGLVKVSRKSKDLNKRGRSPADASMDFLRMSRSDATLGGAYEKYAADDVRLLLEGEPTILGKKKVVAEMNGYVAAGIPNQMSTFQAADLAYMWYPCDFTNNGEGLEDGNCLQIWKLRNKKWWIVLGVYAKLPNETKPLLKTLKN